MLVKDYMSKNLVTISKGTKIFDAVELMNQKRIHRIPVTEENAIIGLITEGTIQEAMPSKATSLSVYEANYLLNKTKVEDVMIREVETILDNCLLEEAIFKMRQHKVNVLPVLNEKKELVGIITNNDIFDAFLSITGYKKPGTRVAIKIKEDHEGILADLTKIFADNHLNIIQIVVYRKDSIPIVVIQTTSEENQKVNDVLKTAGYYVISSIQTYKR